MGRQQEYLALGDSMSIDDYTGVEGSGAANQFARTLGEGWTLDDRTYDGCRMAGVPRDACGDLITLTIGGNDLLCNKAKYLRAGLDAFAAEHYELLQAIRKANPHAVSIVGDVYAPAMPLSSQEQFGLAAANAAIGQNCERVGAVLAPIYDAFRSHESEYLCWAIEPNFKGAAAIAKLFNSAMLQSPIQTDKPLHQPWSGANCFSNRRSLPEESF